MENKQGRKSIMVKWVSFLSIFIFTTVFSLGLILFIYQIQSNNHSQQTIVSEGGLSSLNSSFSTMLGDFGRNVSIQQQSALNESFSEPTGAFVMFNIITSLGRFISLPIKFFNSIIDAIQINLGIPSIVSYTFVSLAILIGIFLWYRTVKIGD
jgi:hypothetical protein